MDTSILDALAASGWPLISSPPVPQVVLENPSTLELGMIGIVTLAAYWTVCRLLPPSRRRGAAGANFEQPGRKAA